MPYKKNNNNMESNKMMEILVAIQEDLKTKATSTELQEIVNKLDEKEERLATLEVKVKYLEDEVKSRDERIDMLAERIDLLENTTRKNEHVNLSTAELLSRKIDDQEQVSRKVNLRVVGIKVEENETPDTILSLIKSECARLELGLCDADFDHCHRNGKVVHDGGISKQTVL